MRENYETFYERVRHLFSPADLAMIDLAYVLAKHSHRNQTRKDEKDEETGQPLRYFEHPRRVAIIILDEVGCKDLTLIIGGFLHDGTEDTRFLTLERIERYFGKEVADLVKMVTKLPPAPGKPKVDQACLLMRFGSWRAMLLKACDRLDNLRSMVNSDPAFIAKQILETKTKYYPLFDLMVERVPKRWKKGAESIRTKIHAMVQHLEGELEKAASGSDD